jgi:hypothetical protein
MIYFHLLIATSASRSFENRTTPVSSPRISANLTSPISRNLSLKFCHVQIDGSCKKEEKFMRKMKYYSNAPKKSTK